MDAISKWAQFVGRVALGLIFVISGAGKLAAWHGTVAYAASKGVPEILLVIATVLELGGRHRVRPRVQGALGCGRPAGLPRSRDARVPQLSGSPPRTNSRSRS